MNKISKRGKVRLSLVLIGAIFSALSATGCVNNEQKTGKATVYGVTDGSPIVVEMEVDGDGKILEVSIDEFLSVRDIGTLTFEDGAYRKCGKTVRDREGRQAKRVRIGKDVFVYENGEYVCDGQNASDYVAVYGSRYIGCLKRGDFDLVDEAGENCDIPFDVYDGCRIEKTEWADKMKNGYREGVEYETGWKEDMFALGRHLVNHGFFGYVGDERANKKGTFEVGGYDTLVSVPNFHDYMRVARIAYDEAKKKISPNS